MEINMTKKPYRTLVLIVLISLMFSPAVKAQDEAPQITIGLVRNMGYGGFSGEIQGAFTISASSDSELEKVVFYFNDIVLGEDTEAPYKLQFNTEVIEPGQVVFSAVGHFTDGSTDQSNSLSRTVLSEDSVIGNMSGMIIPILVAIALVVVVSVAFQFVRGKKGAPFTPGKYGAAGGAICPKCSLPFSRNFISPNLLVGKLERCPHCGKISLRPRASVSALKEAEARYLEFSNIQNGQTAEKEEDKMRKMIDDSRFDH
jgi:hypothetical protein